jgi:hypothetical protein
MSSPRRFRADAITRLAPPDPRRVRPVWHLVEVEPGVLWPDWAVKLFRPDLREPERREDDLPF